jgi:hypothetical protein
MSVHRQIDLGFGFGVAAAALAAMIGAGMQNGTFADLGRVLIFGAFIGFLTLVVRTAVKAGLHGQNSLIRAKEKTPDRTRFLRAQIIIRTRLRCPYCHDSLTGEISECSGCKANLHDDCLLEARGCVTLGCQNRAPKRTVRV